MEAMWDRGVFEIIQHVCKGRDLVTPGLLPPSLCYAQVLYPSLKEAKERTCQSPLGFSCPIPTQHLKTLAHPKKQLQKPRHLGRDYEIRHVGVREASITQKGKQKETVRTGSHRSPNVIIKEAQVYFIRLLRETH